MCNNVHNVYFIEITISHPIFVLHINYWALCVVGITIQLLFFFFDSFIVILYFENKIFYCICGIFLYSVSILISLQFKVSKIMVQSIFQWKIVGTSIKLRICYCLLKALGQTTVGGEWCAQFDPFMPSKNSDKSTTGTNRHLSRKWEC